jgi:hypothetical protein
VSNKFILIWTIRRLSEKQEHVAMTVGRFRFLKVIPWIVTVCIVTGVAAIRYAAHLWMTLNIADNTTTSRYRGTQSATRLN